MKTKISHLVTCYKPNISFVLSSKTHFSQGHLPEACREIEIEIEIDRMDDDDEGGMREGPLAKNQPEASPRAVS